MNKILCYCEFNNLTGFGHYNRIRVILDILKLKNVDILTENYNSASKIFYDHNIIKCTNIFDYIKKNYLKYKMLIIDPPYYPNQAFQQEKFSKKFKTIYNLVNKKFKVIWLTDEEKPSPKFCDLLLNDYPVSHKFRDFYKKNNNNIKLILGIYAFLYDKEILKLKNIKKNKHILIAFGGDDPKNLILKYFNVFKNLKGKKFFLVNLKTYEILKKYNGKKDLIIEKKKSMSKYVSTLANCSYYIATPSNIMFEAISLNKKGNVIPIQKRQKSMGLAFEKLRLVNLLPNYKKLNLLKLKKKLVDFNLKQNNKNFEFKKKSALRTQTILKKFYIEEVLKN